MVSRRGRVAAALVLAACGGPPRTTTPGMPPVCDPAPWTGDDVPRLVAPFDADHDPAVEAAGLDAVPHLLNLDEVQRSLVAEFLPIMMQSDEVPTGDVRFWLLVDAGGRVRTVDLHEGSGDERLDAAARRVVRILALTPAVRGGCRVPVWVRYPIRFQARGATNPTPSLPPPATA